MQIADLFTGVRIPQVVVAPDGSVLAFADKGRLVRRSTDGGDTFSDPTEVGPDAGGSVVIDTTTGDVMVVQSRDAFLYRSHDNGRTWTREPMTLVPNVMGHGTPGTVPFQTTCSESGLTLQFGQHKDRLVMPGRIQPPRGTNDQEFWALNYNAAITSDDHGATWQVSEPVQSGTGEGTLAELSDGRIYYNSRCHMAVDHRRRIAWSHDGGGRFVDWQVSDWLYEIGEPFYFKYGSKPSYGCNAGLVRLPDGVVQHDDVLLYSAPDNPGTTRHRMTVWASIDGAVTWPTKLLVDEGMSAYSSITAGPDGTVYLLYESGDEKLYDVMRLARFNVTDLLDRDG